MMLFQRRIYRELLWNTLTTLLLLTLVLVFVMSAQVVQRTEGLTLVSFLRSVPIFAAAQMDLTLPIAILVAVVFTYGRAAADNEIDTLRASGVHPLHVVTPGLVFGASMAVVLIVGMDYLKPIAERAKKRLVKDIPIAALLENKLAAGEPVSLDDRTIISVEEFDADGNAKGMRVQLYDGNNDLEREIVAKTAELRVNAETGEFEVTLRDFHTVKGAEFQGTQMIIRRPLPKDRADLYHIQMTTPQLMAWLQRHPDRRGGFSTVDAELEVHRRVAASQACLGFVLLGLPVALLFRRHDRTAAFLIAFLLALFVYYPSREISYAFTTAGVMSPFAASWMGNGFLVVIGLGLCWKVFRR